MTTTRRHLLRSVLIATAARTAVAGLTTTAALLSSHHTLELSAYSAPIDQPGCVSAYKGLPGEDPTVQYCDQYAAADDGPDDVAACLLAMGYHGKPGDEMETIYAPAADIEYCAGDDPANEYAYATPVAAGTWAV